MSQKDSTNDTYWDSIRQLEAVPEAQILADV